MAAAEVGLTPKAACPRLTPLGNPPPLCPPPPPPTPPPPHTRTHAQAGPRSWLRARAGRRRACARCCGTGPACGRRTGRTASPAPTTRPQRGTARCCGCATPWGAGSGWAEAEAARGACAGLGVGRSVPSCSQGAGPPFRCGRGLPGGGGQTWVLARNGPTQPPTTNGQPTDRPAAGARRGVPAPGLWRRGGVAGSVVVGGRGAVQVRPARWRSTHPTPLHETMRSMKHPRFSAACIMCIEEVRRRDGVAGGVVGGRRRAVQVSPARWRSDPLHPPLDQT